MMKVNGRQETGRWLKEIFRHCTANGKYLTTDITVKEAAEIVSGIRVSGNIEAKSTINAENQAHYII